MTAVKKSIAMSMKTFTRTVDNQRWRLDVNWAALTKLEYREIAGFLINKASNNFTVQIPELKDGEGAWSNVTIDMTALDLINATTRLTVASDNIIETDVAPGDFFTIGSYTKVYQVTEVTDVDISGNPTKDITFFPALVDAPTIGDTLNGTNISFTVKLVDNEVVTPISNNQSYSMSYSALEV